jgi:outer membrane protein assembly factor BamB
VAVVIERGAQDSARVWTRTTDGTMRCAERPQMVMNHMPRRGEDPGTEFTPCAGKRPPAPERFAFPARGADVSPARAAQLEAVALHGDTVADSLGAWRQYRRDARHDGVLVAARTANVTWHNRVSGELRSTPSVADGVVMVGSHGTGTLAAFDATTGQKMWSHRLPNWIHQDAVSDGEFVVVGFGDNHASFTGRLPAGVAAYSLHTGVRAWTVFDESSIMTSPVIVGPAVVYASASGRLRRRDLATGALLAERQLPGGVIMAPPALVGDTLVVALDPATVCAVHVHTFATLWCRAFPKAFMMGHYALTVNRGVVYAASSQVLQALTLREVLQMPVDRWPRVVEALVSPRFFAAGQRLHAMRLHDGSLQWESSMRVTSRDVGGHPAGTAVVDGRYGAIMYPAQDSLVGFDAVSGAIRWTLGGRGTRGPLLLHDGLVIHAGRDGGIESRDIATGALRCRVQLPVGFDRAGPTIAGDVLYVADVEGGVHAMPAALVTRCTTPRYSDSPQPKRAKTDG